MKLRVVGWTDYDNPDISYGYTGCAAFAAVVDEIKKCGYLFSGKDHQEEENCAPVFNDGMARLFTMRGFGRIMAEAHGDNGLMDYALYSFEVDPQERKIPDESFDIESFIPETDLSESFTVEVPESTFTSCGKKGGKIKLEDVPCLKYLDRGDRLILKCGDKTAEFSVVDAERKKAFTGKEENIIDSAIYSEDQKLKERAREIYKNAKIIITVSVVKL